MVYVCGDFVFGPCFELHLAEEERAGCFTLIVFLLSYDRAKVVFCICSSWCRGFVYGL